MQIIGYSSEFCIYHGWLAFVIWIEDGEFRKRCRKCLEQDQEAEE